MSHTYGGWYRGSHRERIAFPLGGLGAGMICVEGGGGFTHASFRHRPEIRNEPMLFSALYLRDVPQGARLLEGPVPGWKISYPWDGQSGSGGSGRIFGLPRFSDAGFLARFPFATIALEDATLPVEARIEAWSPFLPLATDDSSLPVAALEVTLRNTGRRALEGVYSFHARNVMAVDPPVSTEGGAQTVTLSKGRGVRALEDGFVLWQPANPGRPADQGALCARSPGPGTVVNACWFRGGWFDALSMLWNEIERGETPRRAPPSGGGPSPGGSLYVPFRLEQGSSRLIRLELSWHVPHSQVRVPEDTAEGYTPWYAARFRDVDEVAAYWRREYERLRSESARFRDAFFDTDLPPEIVEAVAANLSILKTPTVLREKGGRLWAWEGCNDQSGCCHGSCTHVWNYAQALPHLFPDLERSLRETEFRENQDDAGHQSFRASLPIRPAPHSFFAASDGQLGGVVKVWREWRVSGDEAWAKRLWPAVKKSLDYCIATWDPRGRGLLEEPHHNTYDVEFWGPDGMCTSFYHAALEAACRMGTAFGEDVSRYRGLLEAGKAALAAELWNGEYIQQKVVWKGLSAGDPSRIRTIAGDTYSSPEAMALLEKEGPKYQYGTGCLSDGVLGYWLAAVCGLGEVGDPDKVRSHLRAVYRNNFQTDLSRHANPQRPTYALGREAGLLLCTWPRGGRLSLPFPYAMEVWTGIEYHVAAHLMMCGMVTEGLSLVRAVRARYDGSVRDPFDEIECGHWYARAMSSYALLQGYTGVRYDAVDRTLTVRPTVAGDFRVFLCTATGYGTVGVRDGMVYVEAASGKLSVDRIDYTPCAPAVGAAPAGRGTRG